MILSLKSTALVAFYYALVMLISGFLNLDDTFILTMLALVMVCRHEFSKKDISS